MYTELNQLAAWCLPKRLQQLGYSVQALAVWRWALNCGRSKMSCREHVTMQRTCDMVLLSLRLDALHHSTFPLECLLSHERLSISKELREE